MALPKAWRPRVAIFQDSPALRLRRENGLIVAETPQGAVAGRGRSLSRQQLFRPDACNAHMQHTLVPFRKPIIATQSCRIPCRPPDADRPNYTGPAHDALVPHASTIACLRRPRRFR